MAEILTSVRNYQQFEYSRPEKKVNCLEAFAVGPWFDEDKLYEYSNIVEPKGGTEEVFYFLFFFLIISRFIFYLFFIFLFIYLFIYLFFFSPRRSS